ncbi:hypothetical protein [Pontibacillus salipaludis]|uniref:hypothetical protein n=1 Tax=Pontibacillus salipaludis TaxID=1697394 RepID=UPI0031E93CBF
MSKLDALTEERDEVLYKLRELSKAGAHRAWMDYNLTRGFSISDLREEQTINLHQMDGIKKEKESLLVRLRDLNKKISNIKEEK